MLLYTDILTGDELISDAYDLKEVDDVIYEADCQMIVIKEGEVDIGANACVPSPSFPSSMCTTSAHVARLLERDSSAEEAAEELEEGAQQVNNIVHSFRLTATSFDKKSYMTYLKGYMKAVKAKLAETNPDRVPEFEKAAAGFAKKVLSNFKDYEFYTGESMNPDGMVGTSVLPDLVSPIHVVTFVFVYTALLNYREDGVTPYMIFWKDGLKEVKLHRILFLSPLGP
ncbi:SPOSA6832_00799, partial [Sporobolomyces salmonicolor]